MIKNKNLSISRNEIKYYINYNDYNILIRNLSEILNIDIHKKSKYGYFIRSLYFDSYDNECLQEKQGGLNVRSKYRLRIYDLNSDKVKLEIKNKIGNCVNKETATITRDEAKKMINGEYDFLASYNNQVLNKIYYKFKTRFYRPKVVVDYYRDAFVLDKFDIRITFDKFLSANNTNFDIFSPECTSLPVFTDPRILIMEVKYNKLLPGYIKQLLSINNFQRMAISKYTLSRSLNKINQWEDN